MADNITITPGSGATVATDEVSAAHYQVVKIGVGAANAVDGHLDYGVQASTSSLSVVLASDQAAVSVSGTVTANAGTNLNTSALATEAGAVSSAAASLAVMDDWDNGASDGASVSGDVAHGTADAGEPVKLGAKGVSAEPAVVDANDRVNLQADLTGRLVVSPYALQALCATSYTTITGTTATYQLLAAAGAGVKNYITGLILANSDTATSCTVSLMDGASTVKMVLPAPKDGGAVIPLSTPFVGTANTSTSISCSAAATSVSCSVTYYTGV